MARSLAPLATLLEKAGRQERLVLPHRRFHRHQGEYASSFFDPAGEPMNEEVWESRRADWLPVDCADLAPLAPATT